MPLRVPRSAKQIVSNFWFWHFGSLHWPFVGMHHWDLPAAFGLRQPVLVIPSKTVFFNTPDFAFSDIELKHIQRWTETLAQSVVVLGRVRPTTTPRGGVVVAVRRLHINWYPWVSPLVADWSPTRGKKLNGLKLKNFRLRWGTEIRYFTLFGVFSNHKRVFYVFLPLEADILALFGCVFVFLQLKTTYFWRILLQKSSKIFRLRRWFLSFYPLVSDQSPTRGGVKIQGGG